MGYSAKVQGHKASAPSSKLGGPARRIVPSPSPTAPIPQAEATPADWSAWIERADQLGHSLERLVQPTLKTGSPQPLGSLGMGVVQLKNGKKGKGKGKRGKAKPEAKAEAPPAVAAPAPEEEPAAEEPAVAVAEPAVAAADAAADEEEPVFESLGAMIAHVASRLPFDPEQLQEMAESSDLFSGHEYTTPSAIDENLAEWKKNLEGLERHLDSIPSPGAGKKKGDWAAGSVRREAKDAASGGGPLFPGGQYTLHHKISRHQLRSMATQMNEAGDDAKPVTDFLDELGGDIGSGNQLRTLLSMPGNLELGPPADQRESDPGEGFDPNVTASGEMTPRSAELSAVDSEITGGKIDWDDVAARLRKVQALQTAQTGAGKHLTPPLASQWSKNKNKYKRG